MTSGCCRIAPRTAVYGVGSRAPRPGRDGIPARPAVDRLLAAAGDNRVAARAAIERVDGAAARPAQEGIAARARHQDVLARAGRERVAAAAAHQGVIRRRPLELEGIIAAAGDGPRRDVEARAAASVSLPLPPL